MEDLNKYLSEIMEKENRKPRANFEGYSPTEMTLMLYYPLNEQCPVQIQELEDEEYLEIPVFKQTRHLLEIIQKNGELKLTPKGNLPVKVVQELYEQSSLKNWWIEKGGLKNYKEGDIETITLSRILLEISPLSKKEITNSVSRRRARKSCRTTAFCLKSFTRLSQKN